MLSRSTRALNAVARRGFAAQAAPAAAAAAVPADPEHAAWLNSVKKLPVTVPKFEWTLEWALPTPVPQHQFEQSPVVIEVTDRNPDPEKLVQNGPDAVGGYPDPNNAQAAFITVEEHAKRGYSKGFERVWLGAGAGASKFADKYANSGLK